MKRALYLLAAIALSLPQLSGQEAASYPNRHVALEAVSSAEKIWAELKARNRQSAPAHDPRPDSSRGGCRAELRPR
jgi:hypothetical protein